MPVRIRLSRAKGWRMPPDTVNVARPTKWGNPFVIGKPHPYCTAEEIAEGCACATPLTRDEAVDMFEALYWSPDELAELRGKDIACWCRLDQSCHGDSLLRQANAEEGVMSAPTWQGPEEPPYTEDSDECWECGGEGGWNSCPEDCCPHIWGEEGCDDLRCWRRCPTCRGQGVL